MMVMMVTTMTFPSSRLLRMKVPLTRPALTQKTSILLFNKSAVHAQKLSAHLRTVEET